jgi:hypothetical protein
MKAPGFDGEILAYFEFMTKEFRPAFFSRFRLATTILTQGDSHRIRLLAFNVL